MKTIQIPDDIYNELMALSEKMNEQDNRGTASPYFFQIRKREKQYVPESTGDFIEYLAPDLDHMIVEINTEGIENYCETIDLEYPAGYKDWDRKQICDWLEEQDLDRLNYVFKEKYENAFFTAEGCKDHIRRNKHHYPDPETVDFLSHAWRNPEMELVCNFLSSLTKPVEAQS